MNLNHRRKLNKNITLNWRNRYSFSTFSRLIKRWKAWGSVENGNRKLGGLKWLFIGVVAVNVAEWTKSVYNLCNVTLLFFIMVVWMAGWRMCIRMLDPHFSSSSLHPSPPTFIILEHATHSHYTILQHRSLWFTFTYINQPTVYDGFVCIKY